MEQALQIAEDGDDVEVVALTLGPDDAADAIKRALQMGASAGIHVNDDAVHGSDALATSADPGRGDPQGRARPGDLRHGVHRRHAWAWCRA